MSNNWMYVPDITTAGNCNKPEHKIEVVPAEYDLEDEARDQVTISMGLDPKLAEHIADAVERKVTDEMKANVYDLIIKKTSYYGRPRYSDAKKYNLQDWVVEEIKNAILENKEEIIQAAAEKLADSMRRSKPVRERFCDILEEELEQLKKE